MNKYFLLSVWLAFTVHPIRMLAVEVQQSTSSRNAVVILLASDETDQARRGFGSSLPLGREAAIQVLGLAGVPESISGKVAYLPVLIILAEKYARDMHRYATRTGAGSSFMLKYYGVNIDGLRQVWLASGVADELLPGGPVGSAVVEAVNEMANILIQSSTD
jgi:hypothetical protein